MNILIAGGHGQLGRDCSRLFSGSHQVHAVTHREMDVGDPSSIERLCRTVQPEVIINCAAFTRVDDCESNRQEAWQVNAAGPANLAEYAASAGVKLVHISTDYVFDGSREAPNPYNEEDSPQPLSWYGRSKLAGEEGVVRSGCAYLIARTAWLYGIDGTSFLTAILRQAVRSPGRTLRVVNDRFGSPTWSYRLANQLELLLEHGEEGLYHITAEGHCSWYELAVYFFDKIGVPNRVEPCSTAEYAGAAPRPANSILENGRLIKEKQSRMRHWQSDIDQFILLYKDRLIKEAERVS